MATCILCCCESEAGWHAACEDEWTRRCRDRLCVLCAADADAGPGAGPYCKTCKSSKNTAFSGYPGGP